MGEHQPKSDLKIVKHALGLSRIASNAHSCCDHCTQLGNPALSLSDVPFGQFEISLRVRPILADGMARRKMRHPAGVRPITVRPGGASGSRPGSGAAPVRRTRQRFFPVRKWVLHSQEAASAGNG